MALELACSEKALKRVNHKHPVNVVIVLNFDFLTLAINLNGLLMY